MPELKFGIQLRSLRLPFKKALHTAAELGAAGVEIDARRELRPSELSHTGVRQLRKMLDDLNLRVVAIGFRTQRGYNVEEDLDRRIEATKRAMQLAYDLGSPVVVNHVGRVPAEPEGPAWNLLIDALGDLGRYGQRVGVTLAARTGSESGAELKRLLDALPPAAVAVDLDPGNLEANGLSAVDAVAELGPSILHVHAKDGTHDLALGRGVEVPLGRGSVDWTELLGALEEHGYRGYFTIEREHADDPVAEIALAMQFLRAL